MEEGISTASALGIMGRISFGPPICCVWAFISQRLKSASQVWQSLSKLGPVGRGFFNETPHRQGDLVPMVDVV